MKETTAQRFGFGKSFQSPSVSAAVLGAALLASGTTDDAETAWSPSAACLLPDVLPVAGTLLSYGGSRQLAAGGTVTHSGNLSVSGVIIAPLGMIASANNAAGVQVSATSLIPATGNGYGYNDNAADLGIAASRWRDLNIGRNAVVGGNITASGAATISGLLTLPSGFRSNDRSLFDGVLSIGGSLTASLIHPSAMRATWTNTSLWSGTIDTAIGRDSAGVVGLYTSDSGSTKAALTCGAITASGIVTFSGTAGSSAIGGEIHSGGRTGVLSSELSVGRYNGIVHGYHDLKLSTGNGSYGYRNSVVISGVDHSATFAGAITASGDIIAGTATDFISIGASTSSVIGAYSNALGYHYQLIGDSTGGGGPMVFRIGAGGTIEWRSTNRADTGTTDLSFGRDSANVFGIYTDSTKATKAALTCGAITASGVMTVNGVTLTGNSSYGLLYSSARIVAEGFFASSGSTNKVWVSNAHGTRVASDLGFQFATNEEVSNPPDLQLTRQSAGVLQIGTTTANASGSLLLTNLTASGALTVSSALNVVSNTSIYWQHGGSGTKQLEINSGTGTVLRWSTTELALGSSGITSTSSIQETPTQSALDPTTTNIPSGKRQGWYNSTLAEFRDWVNIGGTLLKSAAYT